MHLHLGGKAPGLHHGVGGAGLGDEVVEQPAPVLRCGGLRKPGRLPVVVSAARVNWLTSSRPPPTSCTLRFILPASSLKMRSLSGFGQQPVGFRPRCRRAGDQRQQSRPDLAHHLARPHARLAHLCRIVIISVLEGACNRRCPSQQPPRWWHPPPLPATRSDTEGAPSHILGIIEMGLHIGGQQLDGGTQAGHGFHRGRARPGRAVRRRGAAVQCAGMCRCMSTY